MTQKGRPLRFLVLVLAGWVGMRTWQLWPASPGAGPLGVARGPVERREGRLLRSTMLPAIATPIATGPLPHRRIVTVSRVRVAGSIQPVLPSPALPETARVEGPVSRAPAFLAAVPELPAASTAPPRRWSASGWAIVRGSGAEGGGPTPQLGGSQAGIRLARALDAGGRLAIAARVATAIETRQQEAALGIEWRPTSLPVRIIAERRFGVAGQRGGSAFGVIGGISDRPLPAGFRLDGYAQAGAVLRDDMEGFADGAARLTRPVVQSGGGTTLALGIGLWGGAQRGATRLDLGPAATIDLPVTHAAHLRVAVEWRQRVVGAARPASGPALSLGTDY